MSAMKDYYQDVFETAIKILAKVTGYTFDFLLDVWLEVCDDRDDFDWDDNWKYFVGVTLERDW